MIVMEQQRGYFARMAEFVRRGSIPGCFPALGASAAVFTTMLLVDPGLQVAVQSIHTPLVLDLVHFGGWLGQGTSLWVILLGIYAAAMIFRHTAVKVAAFGCVVSAALASVLSSIIKWTVARARPNANLGHLSFFHWSETLRNHARFQSFPSGDVVIVAAVAWYFFYRCRKAHLSVRLILFILPLATACSRVLLNKHWPSDVIFSIGLAWAAAQCVVRYEKFYGTGDY